MPRDWTTAGREDERETAARPAPAPALAPDAARVLAMQQGAGNAAVARMLVARETKETERGILEHTAPDAALGAEDREDLIDKTRKGQSLAQARKIAAEVEAESERLVASIADPNDQAEVRAAIKNYVSSSTAIQDSARQDDVPTKNVLDLDKALKAIRAQMAENEKRKIVYRSISYDALDEIPYGNASASGEQVQVGDTVFDYGFLSTSEHRQFILGKTQTKKKPGLVRFVINSRTGVPIALHFDLIAYSNPNEKAFFEQQEAKKNLLAQVWNKAFGAGPGAGQAEILFGRETEFTVTQIDVDEGGASVVLEERQTPADPGNRKNMKTGALQ
jgi:hypothetical protein